MTCPVEQVFWRAVDDLNAGHVKPIDTYLNLVADADQDELAEMLAAVLSERGPAPGPADPRSEGYARALAAIDEVSGTSGPAGVLPAALRTMRHARGIDREQVVEELAAEYEIAGPDGRKALERFYHRLEAGKLLGLRLTRELLASLARIVGADVEDLAAGSRSTGPAPPLTLAPTPGMARTSGEDRPTLTRREPERVGRDPEVELVERLFIGGRDD